MTSIFSPTFFLHSCDDSTRKNIVIKSFEKLKSLIMCPGLDYSSFVLKKRYSRTRYARFEPRFSSNPDHKKSDLSRYLCALDWIAHHLCSKKRYSRTRYARFEPRFSSNPDHKKSDLSRYLCALDWTRTSTAVATTPSRLRVYQFHHQGIE